MDLHIAGKTALVTGASQGLGRAIVKSLAAEGVKVFATASNEERLASLISEIAASGGVMPVTFAQDFAAADSPQNIAAAALAAMGHIDILINNAAGSAPVDTEASAEHWTESMTLSFDRHLQVTEQLMANFLERKSGSIVTISGNLESKGMTVARVSKAGLISWAKDLSEELGPHGVTVNCVQPGLIDTSLIRSLYSKDERKRIIERDIAVRDLGLPEDVGNAVAFLASPRARYITGTVLVVDGGMRR